MSAARLRGLAAAADRRVETLILGSFPSEASLAAGRYYAHPRNQFWRILSAVLDEPLAAMPYAQRLACLRAHGIGLWDVIGACERAGSLDAAIRNEQENDVAQMLLRMPRLRRVLFNGQRAARAVARFQAIGLETAVVPSSSPAHAALSLAAKVALWQQALADGRRKARRPAPARSTG
jgi:hypoxanthine-DNA glycosylase